MSITVYHNPENAAGQAVINRLRAKGIDPQTVELGDKPMARTDIITLLNHLGLGPRDLLAEKMAETAARDLTGMVDMIAKRPGIISQPIVITQTRGRLCRDAELVDDLIDA